MRLSPSGPLVFTADFGADKHLRVTYSAPAGQKYVFTPSGADSADFSAVFASASGTTSSLTADSAAGMSIDFGGAEHSPAGLEGRLSRSAQPRRDSSAKRPGRKCYPAAFLLPSNRAGTRVARGLLLLTCIALLSLSAAGSPAAAYLDTALPRSSSVSSWCASRRCGALQTAIRPSSRFRSSPSTSLASLPWHSTESPLQPVWPQPLALAARDCHLGFPWRFVR